MPKLRDVSHLVQNSASRASRKRACSENGGPEASRRRPSLSFLVSDFVKTGTQNKAGSLRERDIHDGTGAEDGHGAPAKTVGSEPFASAGDTNTGVSDVAVSKDGVEDGEKLLMEVGDQSKARGSVAADQPVDHGERMINNDRPGTKESWDGIFEGVAESTGIDEGKLDNRDTADDAEESSPGSGSMSDNAAEEPSGSSPSRQQSVSSTGCPPVQEYFVVKENRKTPNCKPKIFRTDLAKRSNVEIWRQLQELQTVQHAGVHYCLDEVVYVYTSEGDDSPARIREIRDTKDDKGRIDICVSWLYSEEEVRPTCNNPEDWSSGATHIDSDRLQIVPWDTLNGHPTKMEVRPCPKKILSFGKKFNRILKRDDAALKRLKLANEHGAEISRPQRMRMLS
ncbi:hypothetical protein WHR41_09673 [Cladosporium halotolerans]|uniref:BAH domain-containing protein n=1 Tax=Cladosporium halotolerans TaxID=1052096 RepID=A0AB34KDK5_9PEZI